MTTSPAGPTTAPVMPGAEPLSHDAGSAGAPGLLALHGFTGNASSMRGVAEAFVSAGYHVELPLLAGHGTDIADMLATTWSDWRADVESAYRRLAARTERIVVAGLSMGGTLALWTALAHPDVLGLVLVNPATQPQPDDVREMIAELLADGTTVVPGIGSDIADPDAVELAYPGTPLAPLISFQDDGLVPLTTRFGDLTAPLLLFTSRQDHVIDPSQSEHLAATYGGAVDHRWLDRSYHVATNDYDRHDIVCAALQFANRLVAA